MSARQFKTCCQVIKLTYQAGRWGSNTGGILRLRHTGMQEGQCSTQADHRDTAQPMPADCDDASHDHSYCIRTCLNEIVV